MPLYNIEVDTGSDGEITQIVNAEFEEHRTYRGSKLSSKIKYDYVIAGWDYATDNDQNPKLFLGTDISLLHSMDEQIGDRLLKQRFIQKQQEYKERLEYQNMDGMNKELYLEHDEKEESYEYIEKTEEPDDNTRGDDSDYKEESPEEDDEIALKNYEQPELVENNQMKFADNLYKLGSFSWVNNVTADGRNLKIKFQIHHAGVLKKFFEGKVFEGMIIKGGFNLPGANRIHHDPTFANEIYELEIVSEDIPQVTPEEQQFLIKAGILLIIIVVVLIAFYASIRTASDKKMTPPRLPNGIPPKTVMDRDKMEKKKSEEEEYYENYYVDWED